MTVCEVASSAKGCIQFMGILQLHLGMGAGPQLETSKWVKSKGMSIVYLRHKFCLYCYFKTLLQRLRASKPSGRWWHASCGIGSLRVLGNLLAIRAAIFIVIWLLGMVLTADTTSLKVLVVLGRSGAIRISPVKSYCCLLQLPMILYFSRHEFF